MAGSAVLPSGANSQRRKRGLIGQQYQRLAEFGVFEADAPQMTGVILFGAVNLCGRTGLTDVLDLMSLCRVVVCNDSGLMHVAAAAGCMVVAIYGSSTPEYTPPLTDRAVIVRRELECSPCFARACPLGHGRCLGAIGVGEVLRNCMDHDGKRLAE